MDIQTPRTSKKRHFPVKKGLKVVVMILIVAIPVVVLLRIIRKPNQNTTANQSPEVAGMNSEGVMASVPINIEIPIPVKDGKGAEVGVLTMSVPSAEKRDEIIVKGKKATAVEGRDFLLLNLKIVNPMDKGISINTRDFFRLNVNGSNEWFAPEIHNDPVEVQAISTKTTRVGFPVNETDQNLILQIGQIDGEKQQVPLNF